MTTISVTQDDIEHGERGDCRGCPIARAVNRMLATGYFARVRDEISIWTEGGGRFVRGLDLPDAAREFIALFDSNNGDPDDTPVKPFTFEIPDIPAEYLKG
jgi:hypothetical protein